MYSNPAGYCEVNLSPYLVFKIVCGSRLMKKSVFYPTQAVPGYGHGGLGWPVTDSNLGWLEMLVVVGAFSYFGTCVPNSHYVLHSSLDSYVMLRQKSIVCLFITAEFENIHWNFFEMVDFFDLSRVWFLVQRSRSKKMEIRCFQTLRGVVLDIQSRFFYGLSSIF